MADDFPGETKDASRLRAEMTADLREMLSTERTVNVMRVDWEKLQEELKTLRRLHEVATERSAALRLAIEQIAEKLSFYNESGDGELRECAREDRWRLYRDLDAIIEEALQ